MIDMSFLARYLGQPTTRRLPTVASALTDGSLRFSVHCIYFSRSFTSPDEALRYAQSQIGPFYGVVIHCGTDKDPVNCPMMHVCRGARDGNPIILKGPNYENLSDLG